jgi:hypothetical protein
VLPRCYHGRQGLVEPGDRGLEIGPVDVEPEARQPGLLLRPVERMEQSELPPRLALAAERHEPGPALLEQRQEGAGQRGISPLASHRRGGRA